MKVRLTVHLSKQGEFCLSHTLSNEKDNSN